MAIDQCRVVVENPDTDTAVSAYLTRHVNVLMCAEIESVVSKLVLEKVERSYGTPAANFLNSIRKGRKGFIPNAQYSEIVQALGLFGTAYRDEFKKAVNEAVGEEGIAMLGIAVGKRNETAHTQTQPDITFREVETAFEVADAIVSIARDILQE